MIAKETPYISYLGFLKHGQPNGYARIDWKDGTTYVGQLDRGEITGFGTYQFGQPGSPGSYVKRGVFKNSVLHGYGRSQDEYRVSEGNFKKGDLVLGTVTSTDQKSSGVHSTDGTSDLILYKKALVSDSKSQDYKPFGRQMLLINDDPLSKVFSTVSCPKKLIYREDYSHKGE